jgi:uncharacterized membrane protein
MHDIPLPFLFFHALLYLCLFDNLDRDRCVAIRLQEVGINRRHIFAVLFLSLFGSYVNIPMASIMIGKQTAPQASVGQ